MNDQTLAVLALFVASPVLGVIVAKFLRPNATPLEVLEQVQEERDRDRERINSLEEGQRTLTVDVRNLADYTHVLRQHIADGKGPPPPVWPEGLKP